MYCFYDSFCRMKATEEENRCNQIDTGVMDSWHGSDGILIN